ncbi:MAG: hypothetical protein HY912_07460 [Desulfomonile tiedjei]|uniref:PsbP C-terminal domain-containing protein n=1 Tax=Desulfomonile tiedjei TaxID=2358 RepID=A0A9D6Z5M9_9BACT|nr:hypothetical protein [Desulfomonile tiedjei]
MKYTPFAKIVLFLLVALLTGAFVSAQENLTDPNVLQHPDRLFDIKIPSGFKSEAVDEPGILKWRKDSGEIYLIVGDLFGESGESLFKVIKSAAEKNKTVQEIKVVKIKGARALTYKEKVSGDSSRLETWHFVVITNKKIFTMDFSAPTNEFNSFVPDFQSTINSFKLKNAS